MRISILCFMLLWPYRANSQETGVEQNRRYCAANTRGYQMLVDAGLVVGPPNTTSVTAAMVGPVVEFYGPAFHAFILSATAGIADQTERQRQADVITDRILMVATARVRCVLPAIGSGDVMVVWLDQFGEVRHHMTVDSRRIEWWRIDWWNAPKYQDALLIGNQPIKNRRLVQPRRPRRGP